MLEIGQMIKCRREAMGLSLKKLAIACGSSDSEIMKIENGTRKKPNWATLFLREKHILQKSLAALGK